jgi:hypothetical protein
LESPLSVAEAVAEQLLEHGKLHRNRARRRRRQDGDQLVDQLIELLVVSGVGQVLHPLDQVGEAIGALAIGQHRPHGVHDAGDPGRVQRIHQLDGGGLDRRERAVCRETSRVAQRDGQRIGRPGPPRSAIVTSRSRNAVSRAISSLSSAASAPRSWLAVAGSVSWEAIRGIGMPTARSRTIRTRLMTSPGP